MARWLMAAAVGVALIVGCGPRSVTTLSGASGTVDELRYLVMDNNGRCYRADIGYHGGILRPVEIVCPWQTR